MNRFPRLRSQWERATRFRSRIPDSVWWGIGVGAACLLGLALRLYLLPDQEVWWDEGWSIVLARRSCLQILADCLPTQHPPLHYLYLHFWIKLVGEGAATARLSSVLFGVATIPAVYRLGARLGSRAVGLAAAALLAIAPFHVHWSQEIRMYAAAAFFSTVSILLLIRMVSRPRAAEAVGFAAATLAMLFTHYATALVLAAECVVLGLAAVRNRRSWRRLLLWGATLASIAAVFGPWMLLHLRRAVGGAGAAAPTFREFARHLATVLSLGESADSAGSMVPVLGAAVIVVAGVVLILRRRGHGPVEIRLLPLLLVLALPVGLYALSRFRQELYAARIEDRYLILFLPLYLVALAQGLAAMARRWRGLTTLVIVVGIGALAGGLVKYYDGRFEGFDVAALGQRVRAYYQAGDAVVVNNDADWPVYAYYLGPGIDVIGIPNGDRMDTGKAAAWLQTAVQSDTVWLVETRDVAMTDESHAVPAFLAQGHSLVATFDYGEARLEVFSRLPATAVLNRTSCGTDTSGRAGGLGLTGAGMAPDRVRAGMSLYSWACVASRDSHGQERVRLVLWSAKGERALESGLVPVSGPAAVDIGSGGLVQVRLGVPGSAADGLYTASLEVSQGDASLGTVELGTVEVVAGERAVDERAVLTLDAEFVCGVLLDGWTVGGASAPDGGVPIGLIWSASEPQELSYSVFVHVLDVNGEIVAQHDGVPDDGIRPTTSWAPGETIRDCFVVPVPPWLPSGAYRVVAGLYDPFSGERVPLVGKAQTGAPEGVAYLGDITVR